MLFRHADTGELADCRPGSRIHQLRTADPKWQPADAPAGAPAPDDDAPADVPADVDAYRTGAPLDEDA